MVTMRKLCQNVIWILTRIYLKVDFIILTWIYNTSFDLSSTIIDTITIAITNCNFFLLFYLFWNNFMNLFTLLIGYLLAIYYHYITFFTSYCFTNLRRNFLTLII